MTAGKGKPCFLHTSKTKSFVFAGFPLPEGLRHFPEALHVRNYSPSFYTFQSADEINLINIYVRKIMYITDIYQIKYVKLLTDKYRMHHLYTISAKILNNQQQV